ncbi:MAG: hypothetical protein JOY71_22535 [Acetobacteraceae bacterium]|nr:hypothetical protein [Acetobacteraceae bacterium]
MCKPWIIAVLVMLFLVGRTPMAQDLSLRTIGEVGDQKTGIAFLVIEPPHRIYLDSASKSEKMPYGGLFLNEFRELNGASWVLSGGLLSSFSPVAALGFLKSMAIQ